MTGILDHKVLRALDNHRDGFTDVDGERCLPVLRCDVVYIDAVCGCHNHVTVLDTHGDDALGVIEKFIKFVQIVDHGDLLILVKHRLNVVPVELAINNIAKGDCTATTCSGQNGTIVRPVHVEKRASLGFVKRMGPTSFVTKAEHLKRAYGKDFSVGSPFDRSDDVIVRQRVVELTAKLVPDSVFAILASGNNQIVGRVPVAC